LFTLIENGSAILEGRAAKAALTTAQGFTVLTNELTRYFGEADKANGVSAALGEALGALGRNLDTVIPAIAAVIGAIGVGYVTNAAAAALATGNFVTVLRGLLTLLGGPVGLAITAVGAALLYTSRKVTETSEATAEYRRQQELTNTVTTALSNATDKLATAHGAARVEALALARAEAENTKKKIEGAKASIALAQAELQRARIQTEADSMAARQGGRAANQGGFFATDNAGRATVRAAESNVAVAKNNLDSLQKGLDKALAAINASKSSAISTGTSETAKEKRERLAAERKAAAAQKRAEREALRAERDQARDESQDRQAQIEVLRARQALTDNVEARADFELQMLAIEKAQRVADVENDRTLSKVERAARLKYIETLYGPVNSDPNAI